MRAKTIRRRGAGFSVAVVLFVGTFAWPAFAGYKEGNISCRSGWDEVTVSTSYSPTWHEHYMESNGMLRQYSEVVVKVWNGSTNYGTWSVQASLLLSGYAYCSRRA